MFEQLESRSALPVGRLERQTEKKPTAYYQFRQARVKGHRHCYITFHGTKPYELVFTCQLHIHILKDSVLVLSGKNLAYIYT